MVFLHFLTIQNKYSETDCKARQWLLSSLRLRELWISQAQGGCLPRETQPWHEGKPETLFICYHEGWYSVLNFIC